MLPENDSDGYHLGFVHLALSRRSAPVPPGGRDEKAPGGVRDGATGTIEIDWSPATRDRSNGGERVGISGGRLTWRPSSAGMGGRPGAASSTPPMHLPHLFLGETKRAIVQPVSVEECVHCTPRSSQGRAPVQLADAPDEARRDGPASFLMPTTSSWPDGTRRGSNLPSRNGSS